MSTTRLSSLALVLVIAVPGAALAQDDEGIEEAGAEDVSVTATSGPPPKTLAERIPSVTRPVFIRKGRIELVPAIGKSLNDPFFENLVLSGGAAYHVFEWLWVGASAEYLLGFANPTPVSGPGNPPRPDYNRAQYAARLEVAWAPFYGKLNLLAEKVLHFDTYIAFGGGILGGTRTGSAFAGSVAIGQHFFITEWMAIRLDVRDQVFSMNRNPGTTEKSLQSFLSASLGVAFYVPPSFEREAL